MNFIKHSLVSAIYVIAVMAVLGPFGCSRDSGPPPPLAAEQIPAELRKAFSSAGTEAKDTVGRIIAALQDKDCATAYQEVQTLCTLPDETKEQRALGARALLTITGLLQTAQAQGDERAATALKLRQISR
jgi:hypothetical protein